MEKFLAKIVDELAAKGLIFLILGAFCWYLVGSQKEMVAEMKEERIKADERMFERIKSLEQQNREYHEDLVECLEDNRK